MTIREARERHGDEAVERVLSQLAAHGENYPELVQQLYGGERDPEEIERLELPEGWEQYLSLPGAPWP